MLLVITLSGILRGISSKIENLLPLIGAKSFAFGRIEGTQTSQLYGFTLLVVEGILFLVFIMLVEMIRMRRKNGKNIFFSLIVKKYSLKPVKYQIAIQSLLIGFVCLLGVLPVSINDTVVQLSIKQALVFASMLSVSIGCVNAFVELQSHETKLVYLVSGKRILSSIRILFVELCDVVLQSTLYFIVLLVWFHFFSSKMVSV